MVDKEFIIPWIQRAENDFTAARHLAENMRPVPTEIVCFHCQQAVEKYLKAFLVCNDEEPPKTHDLTELVKLSCKFDKDFSRLNYKCEYLLPFSVRTRYPGGINPEENDMKMALAYTDDVINFTKEKIRNLQLFSL